MTKPMANVAHGNTPREKQSNKIRTEKLAELVGNDWRNAATSLVEGRQEE